jgi:succinoglycan biosynthesis protein ExoM
MGGRIDYAPEARVTEPVALDRLSFGWLAERRYRMGLTHAGVLMRRHGVSPWRAVPVAGAKLLACACMAVIFAGDRGWRASAALRGVLHAGVVAGLVGRGRR